MQLISIILGENKRHKIMLSTLKLSLHSIKTTCWLPHWKFLISYIIFPQKSCLMLPDHLLLVSVDTMTLHQQTRLSKLSEQNLLGVINNIADFAPHASFYNQYGHHQRKNIVFTISVKIRFSSEKYCVLSWQYYKVKWQELLTSRMHLIRG